MTRSKALMERAQGVMPGGVSSPVRSFRSVGGNPFVAAKADGAYLWDLDGNKYIDLVGSWGALIHGHNHPIIREAILEAASKGTSYGVTCEKEVELCELITKSVPSVEMVRLVNSGTEACMSAIRLARGATSRNIIIKFDGAYHGHSDSFLVAAGSGAATLSVSGSAGVPESTLSGTVVLPFNDVVALEKCFSEHGKKIAGAILEVVCGNIGVVKPTTEFLQTLRRLTKDSGSVLIFDEVMTGFRLSLQGSQGIYQIQPDLTCLGKIIGGGLPVGAYGGKKELMQLIAPLGPVYQAGTLSGNPLATSAGLASLKLILQNEKLFYQNLDQLTAEWKSQLDAHIKYKSYPAVTVQAGSMFSVFFRKEIPQNYSEVKASEVERFKLFFWALMKRGVYFPPSAFEACFLSSAHTEKIMDELATLSIAALDEAYSHG